MSSKPLEEFCLHAIGGGWGQEAKDKKHTELVSVIRGTDIPRANFGDVSSIPKRWETASKVKSRLLQAGDILLEVSGGSAASGQHTGRALFVTSDLLNRLGGRVIPASFCRLLRLDCSNVDPKFITYQISGMHLTGEIAEFENQSTGIANFQFNRFISDICPSIADVKHQRLVSGFLSNIDQRIALSRDVNVTLEAIAQALFKSWFVDFDPVRAKMEGRVPEGMDEATAALFPDSLEESELGLVPKGWKVAHFGDFITRLSVGKKFDQKSAAPSGTVPILDQGRSGLIGFHDEAPGVIASLEDPVVVFANHTCYMRLITFDFSAIQNVLPFKGKGVDTVWAYYATKDRVKFSEYKGHWPDFVIEKIALPTGELTRKFRGVVDLLVQRIRLNELQAESLAYLRDTLLPRLISGKLHVSEAEELIAKAT